ncbi:uroporphyrinogen-III synthase [Aquabacterium sp.]|uniref:uroporphyrinogen-III synthase n=1 Tax=Aquabacterium sp. TaxID=1872578 RepID=UPI003783C7E6
MADGTPAPGAAPLLLVTRPPAQADEWVAQLAARGIAAQALPLLGIADAPDPAALRAAWAGLADQQLAMFVSPSAVERFFGQAPAAAQWPAGTWAGSTGPGTSAALLRAGVPAAAIVSPPQDEARFDSEALWRQLQLRRDWRGARALIVRGEGGRDWLAETLRQHGAQVHFVEAYRRTAPVLTAAQQALLQQALAQPALHLWHFSSSEAVHQLPALAPGAQWSRSRALATHPRIAQAARDIGFGAVQAVDVGVDAVAAHITRSIQSARP